MLLISTVPQHETERMNPDEFWEEKTAHDSSLLIGVNKRFGIAYGEKNGQLSIYISKSELVTRWIFITPPSVR